MGIIIQPVTDIFGAIRKSHQPPAGSNAFLEFPDIFSPIRQDDSSLTIDAITLNAHCPNDLRDHQYNRNNDVYNQFHYPLPVHKNMQSDMGQIKIYFYSKYFKKKPPLRLYYLWKQVVCRKRG